MSEFETQETIDPTKVDSMAGDHEKSGHQEQEVSVETLKEQLQQLRSTNERLLNENKQHKAKRQMAEQEKLLAEGKKDEVIKQLSDRVNDYEAKEQSMLIADAIAREAEKRNCKRWDQLYKLTDGNGIELDPSTGTVIGVKEFFDKYQNDPEYDIFFQAKNVARTENRIPPVGNSQIIDLDYRKNPAEYLYQVKKKYPDKYQQEYDKLWREGVLR